MLNRGECMPSRQKSNSSVSISAGIGIRLTMLSSRRCTPCLGSVTARREISFRYRSNSSGRRRETCSNAHAACHATVPSSSPANDTSSSKSAGSFSRLHGYAPDGSALQGGGGECMSERGHVGGYFSAASDFPCSGAESALSSLPYWRRMSRLRRMAQKLGPHMVQYSPSVWRPAWK